MIARTTRLAPSPTGALHLGNARSFLITWLLARQNGWSVLLRIEDLDGPRIKRGADHEAMEDLRWLGLNWDLEPKYQSRRISFYELAIDRLLLEQNAYACVCSRREAQLSASAPHSEDRSACYPGTCRGRFTSVQAAREVTGRDPSIRFRVPDEIVEFTDHFAGKRQFDAAKELGDFIIAKADRTPAYQLAVVVDDAEMNITDVIRGDDLLESTARQILLYRALKLEEQIPQFTHLPLVLGTDGHRLAKRHGDTRLSHYRSLGVSSCRVLALLARWCGIRETNADVTASDLVHTFRLDALPREPIIFGSEDEAFLLADQS